MDLLSKKVIKELFLKYDAHPSKGMGQNFLISKTVLEKIINAAELKPKDIILEVGPGLGTLTKELAKKVKRVIAVEKDKKMIEILKETLSDNSVPNIEIINSDILKTNLKLPKQYKIVANIPYYLTSPVIRKFLETKYPPEFIVLMVQKEVAQRICAKPPSPPHQSFKKTSGVGARMSLLAVSVQFYAIPKIVSYVSKNCFWPKPKVDSAIIKITPMYRDLISINRDRVSISSDLFFKIVKAGFSQPRKQLAGNLTKKLELDKKKIELWLLKNNISPTQRAETLSIADWINLIKTYK